MEIQNGSSVLHVAMFPWFAFGHISPFVQLSNKLSSNGVRISFFSAPGAIERTKSMLNSGPKIEIISLEIPPVDGLPLGLDNTADIPPDMAELLKKAADQMGPEIKFLLEKLKPHFIFHDFAHQWLPPIASKLGIKTLFFSVFSAVSTAYITVPSRKKPTGETPDLDEMKKPPLGFPKTSITSLKNYEARDFLYVFMSFHGGSSVYDRVLACLESCTAIVAKSCEEMEGRYIDFVKTQFGKPVLLLGPIVPEPTSGKLEERWAKWLDSFPAKSVIFCSFGSETFLTDDQITELVLGLEETELPFFVVLNFPKNEDRESRLKSALPEGFSLRVKEKGVIHTGWVQQQLILAHKSVGCYACHSGFSSITEGILNDCQLVLLPQKGDQFLNSKLVSGDMKVGVEVKRREDDGFFKRGDLCKAIETVMVDIEKEPGKLIRENHGKWRKFLSQKDIHENYIRDLVEEMKEMAFDKI